MYSSLRQITARQLSVCITFGLGKDWNITFVILPSRVELMCSEDGHYIRKTTEYMMIKNTELVGVIKIAAIL